MNNYKLCAAILMAFIAGSVHAVTIATYGVVFSSTYQVEDAYLTKGSGTGTAQLDSNGQLTVYTSDRYLTYLPSYNNLLGSDASMNKTRIFSGILNGAGFNAVSGISQITSCVDTYSFANLSTCPSIDYLLHSLNGVGGIVSLSGGTITDSILGLGNSVQYETLTFTSSVPVPAAAWLFGSGLAGLIGLSKRRK